MKFNTFGLGKAKDYENGQSYGLNANLRFFCGVGFLGLVAPNEVMPHMLRHHGSWAIDDGNQVIISLLMRSFQ